MKAFTLSFGISCGLYMLFIGLVSIFGWGVKFVEAVSSVYIGFTPTFLGAIIGMVWGFVDGAIGGAIIAFVYNKIAGK